MSKRREGSKKLLDWEELERAPNTHGALSFLKSAAEIVSIRRRDPVGEGNEHPQASLSSAKTTTVAAPTTVADQAEKGSRRRAYKVHRCTLVQHGQSLGETSLYQALWSNGRPETPETRLITAGWRTMKKLCGMTDKNCKRNTALLIEKLALEEIGKESTNTRTGRTYRVYSFASTLARRKAAGMEWAVWDRGRRFVQQDGSPLVSTEALLSKSTTVVAATTVVLEATPEPDTMVKTTPVTGANITPGTVVKTTPVLIGTVLGIENKQPSSSTEVSEITSALAIHAALADERAASQLIRNCRASCPDASTREMLEVIREKSAVMGSMSNVRNRIGFLLSSVEAVFEGEGIRSYRRRHAAEEAFAKQRALEETRKQREADDWMLTERDRLTRRLNDPTMSPKQSRRGAPAPSRKRRRIISPNLTHRESRLIHENNLRPPWRKHG